jgi:hypothetical protein
MSPNIDDNNTDRNIRESIDKKESKLATLKVAEAEQRDVGRKIARVDPEIIERLNITSGDTLELISPERPLSNQELSMYKTIAEQFGKPELTDGWRKKVISDVNSPSIA